MRETRQLVFELGVEEIPSAYLPGLTKSLSQRALAALNARRLAPVEWRADGTPRRLVLRGRVLAQQPSERRRVRGPAVRAAYDVDGRPTAAAIGFASRLGIAVDALERDRDGEGQYVFATVDSPAGRADEVLPAALMEAVETVELPRSMRWAVQDYRFIRPVRWILALLDDVVLPVSLFGLAAGRVTYGNRTDHPESITVPSAARYATVLTAAHVMLDREQRRGAILARGEELARAVGGALASEEALLDEVADLVEWPVPFRGQFDQGFLEMPAPVLTTTMVHHQRYFPVQHEGGRLLPAFVGVRNGEGLSERAVTLGNERVLYARLADAVFFYAEDRKTALNDRVDALDGVVFHHRLGTYGQKTRRLEGLAARLARSLGLLDDEAEALQRAARLSRADLVTHVVGEFPELQGIMGGIYAAESGESSLVADAVRDLYRPAYAADRLPATRVGQALSLCDRLDTLAGMVHAGLTPTGSEDALGFRRQALGAARILMRGELAALRLEPLAQAALEGYGGSTPDAVRAVTDFVAIRVKSLLAEHYRADLVDAALGGSAPWDSLETRLQQLAAWAGQAEFDEVLIPFRRVANLAGTHPADAAGPFPEGPERRLAEALTAAEASVGDDWARYWRAAQSLRAPIDQYLADVLVMDEDAAVRQRRLGLLAACSAFLRQGADLSRVTGERKG